MIFFQELLAYDVEVDSKWLPLAYEAGACKTKARIRTSKDEWLSQTIKTARI